MENKIVNETLAHIGYVISTKENDFGMKLVLIKSLLSQALKERDAELRVELEGMIPTRDTQITIMTDGRDPHNTTPESLVAMGYATAIHKFLSFLKDQV